MTDIAIDGLIAKPKRRLARVQIFLAILALLGIVSFVAIGTMTKPPNSCGPLIWGRSQWGCDVWMPTRTITDETIKRFSG